MATRVVTIKFDTEAAERAAARTAEEYKVAFDAVQARLAGFDSARRNLAAADQSAENSLPLNEETEQSSQPEAKAE